MVTIEKAKIADVPQMHKMINQFANKGEMLGRPLSELYENIRDFFVIRDGEHVLGCAALHVNWEDLAEIRSVAVAESSQKKGLGEKLIAACIDEATELGIGTIFCFTYQPGFFKRCNFTDIDKMELPRKVWSDCLRCPKFPNCDESALVYRSDEAA